MNEKTESASGATQRKPWLSLFFATACGVGYIPKAPGTWGSLMGVLVYWIVESALVSHGFGYGPIVDGPFVPGHPFVREHSCMMCILAPITITLAVLGVWVASRVAKFTGKKDPQFVVIDEVSGQFLAYFLALVPLNWKYLALGFILFRLFDIWKPFPARQAESLPGGWGIMADDWIAAIYAATGIWIARALGL